MYIMYVDESGVENICDKTKFFVTAGVIFHEDDLSIMKTEIQNYKSANFNGVYKDAEIHIHSIYRGRGEFFRIDHSQKVDLLKPLYSTLHNLPFTIIAIAIDKQKFIKKHPTYEILEYGHTLLVERFDNFLVEKKNKGIIRIDKTTPANKVKLNQKDAHVLKLINKIRKTGTSWQSPAISIVERPDFLPSHLRKGLQVADAVALIEKLAIILILIFFGIIFFLNLGETHLGIMLDMVLKFIQNKNRRYMIT